MRMTRLHLAALIAVLTLAPFNAAGAAGAPKPVNVQILAFNDFHGNLMPPSGSSGTVATPSGAVSAGGAVYLATHIKQLAATNRNTVLVSSGDLIGASPLLSALFHDEPTIEMANLLRLSLTAVGNHEFDEGPKELLRMQWGGCNPVDGCQAGHFFKGLRGRYLSANVSKECDNKTLFPPYKVFTFNRARVAFIGLGYENTPAIEVPSGVEGLTFLPEVSTANRWIAELKKRGINNIVVLIHDGGTQSGYYNDCTNPTGPFFDYVNELDPEVDVVISAHTHAAYNCLIGGKVVTQAMSYGRILTDIDLTIDGRTREITAVQANNGIVTRDVPPDPAMMALIKKYNDLAMPIAGKVIGSITADITAAANAAGESALGDVVADSQLQATTAPDKGAAVIAFMNPGGIRADLLYNSQYYEEQPGEITYGEAFNVQPFSNNLITVGLTGAQIHDLLEQQWSGGNESSPKVLQVSAGFTYQWNGGGAAGDRVDPGSIQLNGVVLDPAASYRVTANAFLAGGGDNFAAFKQGTNPLVGVMDLDAFDATFAAHSPVPPGPMNRIGVAP